MENLIFDDNTNDLIGFVRDLIIHYKELIKEQMEEDNYEQAKTYIYNLEDIKEFKDYDGLLVCSDNQGFGFTCKPYERRF